MDEDFDYKQAWEDLELAAKCIYGANEEAGRAMQVAMNNVKEKQTKEVK